MDLQEDLLQELKRMPYGSRHEIDFHTLQEAFPPITGPSLEELQGHIFAALNTDRGNEYLALQDPKTSIELLEEAIGKDYEVAILLDESKNVLVSKKLSACPVCGGMGSYQRFKRPSALDDNWRLETETATCDHRILS